MKMHTFTGMGMAVLAAVCLWGCDSMRRAKLELPKDPVTLTVVQRQTKEVPGSSGKVFLKINDITGGQVLLEIINAKGDPYLDTLSVNPCNTVPFTVGKQEYYLFVKELRNFPTSEDFGVFQISTICPTDDQKASCGRAKTQPGY